MVENPTSGEIQRSLFSLAKKLEILHSDPAQMAERLMNGPGLIRALGITEEEIKALSLRAFSVMQAGSYAQAEENFSLLSMLVPNHPYFVQGWGVACLLQDKLEDAEKYFRRSVELAPTEPSYYINLAETLYKLGKSDEAFEAFKRGDELDPDGKDMWVNRARAIVQMASAMATDPKFREEMTAELQRRGLKVETKPPEPQKMKKKASTPPSSKKK